MVCLCVWAPSVLNWLPPASVCFRLLRFASACFGLLLKKRNASRVGGRKHSAEALGVFVAALFQQAEGGSRRKQTETGGSTRRLRCGRPCAPCQPTREAFFFQKQAEAGGSKPKQAEANSTRKGPRHTSIPFAAPVFSFVSRALMESRGSELRATAALIMEDFTFRPRYWLPDLP